MEANLLVKRSKLKEEVRENIEKEHLTSSKVKLDISVSTMEEMMQKIIMRDKLAVQKHHVPLIAKEEEVFDPNHYPTHSNYHRSKNDCFMYSFTDSHENGSVYQPVEDQSANLMCIFYVIPHNDELPN